MTEQLHARIIHQPFSVRLSMTILLQCCQRGSFLAVPHSIQCLLEKSHSLFRMRACLIPTSFLDLGVHVSLCILHVFITQPASSLVVVLFFCACSVSSSGHGCQQLAGGSEGPCLALLGRQENRNLQLSPVTGRGKSLMVVSLSLWDSVNVGFKYVCASLS